MRDAGSVPQGAGSVKRGWGCGGMGVWEGGEDGRAHGPRVAILLTRPRRRGTGGAGSESTPAPALSGRCACHPVPAAAHDPAVVGPLQPLSQIEGRVEQPAGAGEATGAGEAFGQR
jgi:hypothetical protein